MNILTLQVAECISALMDRDTIYLLLDRKSDTAFICIPRWASKRYFSIMFVTQTHDWMPFSLGSGPNAEVALSSLIRATWPDIRFVSWFGYSPLGKRYKITVRRKELA